MLKDSLAYMLYGGSVTARLDCLLSGGSDRQLCWLTCCIGVL